MSEYEKTLAALPSPAPAETAEGHDQAKEHETVTEESESSVCEDAQNEPAAKEKPRYAGIFLKKSAIFLLIGVSCVFFTVSAAALIAGIPVDGSFITRAMLGEFLGGIDNIREVAAYDVEYSPITDRPDGAGSESEVSPLETLENPTAHQSFENSTLDLSNETPYDPDMEEILTMERAIPTADELYSAYGNDAPLVLILHTHATESFADTSADGYRSTDTNKNVVSLGKIVADKLNENGIITIHSTTLFDEDDFTMAYYNASLEIRKTLEQYPSISYIIDIHRDSIESDGVYIAPSTDTEGGTAAQMMFVIGTDYGGSGHTTWRNNLSLAARLQTELNENTPRLMRSINLRSASFNEQFSDGSLLLEIGASASTLEEVQRSAEKFADALVREILGE